MNILCFLDQNQEDSTLCIPFLSFFAMTSVSFAEYLLYRVIRSWAIPFFSLKALHRRDLTLVRVCPDDTRRERSGPPRNGRDRQTRGAHRRRHAADDADCDGPLETEPYRLRRHPERKGQRVRLFFVDRFCAYS